MNNMIKISLVTLAIAFSSQAFADDFDDQGLTCSGKQNAIQTQLDYAKKANNSYRVKGLEKALNDVVTYCSNSDLEKKYQDKIQDQVSDLEKRQQELQEAKAEGKLDKIAKQEAKIKADQADLKDAQDKLDSFYKSLEAESK